MAKGYGTQTTLVNTQSYTNTDAWMWHLRAAVWHQMDPVWPETPGQSTRWRRPGADILAELYEVPSQVGAEGLVDASHAPSVEL